MKIILHSSSVGFTQALKEHAERRLNFALDRFSHVIQSVRVTLEDVNGQRGGVDKKCKILLRLPKKTLVAECRDTDAYRAISTAVERVMFSLSKFKRERRNRMTFSALFSPTSQ
jgi:putative sigma-54 modulation protein